MRRLSFALLLLCVSGVASALKSTAPAAVSLDGRWSVNTALSDDAEQMLTQRRDEDMKRMQRQEEQRRRRMQNDPFAWEPEFAPAERTPQNRAMMEERERAVRQMLGMSKFLNIKQSAGGGQLEIVSEFETRRLSSGVRSQVSLPQGQLADAEAGWDGEWFVIQRNARQGPRITERYRWIKKTDQLEALITIKGDSALAGMKVRRVFDRDVAQAAPMNPAAGPVR